MIRTGKVKTAIKTINLMTRVLWWCAGAQVNILRKLPSEHTKYLATGVLVLISSLYSGLSGAYAFSLVFNNLFLSVLFGITWGLLILTLTRFGVSANRVRVRAEPGAIPAFLSRLFPALPSLILSIIVGIMVSTPLVIKLFEPEINERIHRRAFGVKEELQREIAKIEASIANVESQIKKKDDEVDRLRDLAFSEVDGSGGTKSQGAGPIFRELSNQLNRAIEERDMLRREMQQSLFNEQIRLSELKTQEALVANDVPVADGLLARIQTLSKLSVENPLVAKARWLFTLLFLFVFLSPILIKLLSAPGPYDALLERQEHGSIEKESLAIQKAFTEALSRTELNPHK